MRFPELGALALTLGISSRLYAPSVLIGMGLLAGITVGWRRLAPP